VKAMDDQRIAERNRATKPATVPGNNQRAEAVPTEVVFPVSFSQQRLWFVQQMVPESPAYNLSMALRVRGTLRIDALERAMEEIIRRHEPLRTTFREV